MSKQIVDALQAKYIAQKLEAIANLQNYLSNPVGVGEHPNIVEECDKLVEIIGHADDKLTTLKGIFEQDTAKS
jgi:GTPase